MHHQTSSSSITTTTEIQVLAPSLRLLLAGITSRTTEPAAVLMLVKRLSSTVRVSRRFSRPLHSRHFFYGDENNYNTRKFVL